MAQTIAKGDLTMPGTHIDGPSVPVDVSWMCVPGSARSPSAMTYSITGAVEYPRTLPGLDIISRQKLQLHERFSLIAVRIILKKRYLAAVPWAVYDPPVFYLVIGKLVDGSGSGSIRNTTIMFILGISLVGVDKNERQAGA